MNCEVLDIPVGRNRAPIWPEGFHGSLTHSGNKAICVVKKSRPNCYLGIDIEDIISDKLCSEIEKVVSFKSELVRFSQIFEDRATLITFIFSAKESLFKALYPYVETYFDFLDAEVIFVENETFTIKLVNDISGRYIKGMMFTGKYVVKQEQIVTLVTNHKVSSSILKSLI